jgi:hypothetical protein
MHVHALPTELVAVSDGMMQGRPHVLLFLSRSDGGEPNVFALPLADAVGLHAALSLLLPDLRRRSSSPAAD